MNCENCEKNQDGFYGSGRFCSEKCARSYSTKSKRLEINKKVSETFLKKKFVPWNKGNRKKRNIKICNGFDRSDKKQTQKPRCKLCKKITRSVSNIFCSSKCKVEYDWNKKIEKAIKTGLAPAHQAMAKRLILCMREHMCSVCKNHEWLGDPIPLVLDHISGNSEDWRLDNLRLVCGNCDMKLPTYKSKNNGNGRRYRKEYRKRKLEESRVALACKNK